MKIRFWVQRFNKPDDENEVLRKASTVVPEKVTVCKDFIENRWDHRLGTADLFVSEYGIEAEFNWPAEKFPPLPIYASVGGQIFKRETLDNGSELVHCTITMLSIGIARNVDPWIKSLQEQCPEIEAAKD